MNITITNGHIVDPANAMDAVTSLFIRDDRVVHVGDTPPDGFVPEQRIDATGKLVIPGLIDLSARLGEPGFEYKADIDSESLAAVSAGITTLCCPPDTAPVIDAPAEIEFIEQRQEEVGLARIKVIAAITQGLEGKQLAEMAALKDAGCIGVSNVFAAFASGNVVRSALAYAASHDLTVFIHPEDHELANGGCIHEGAVATRLGLPPMPEAAETAAIGYLLPIIKLSGARVHFCRLSTGEGMNMVRRARVDGLQVTADVCAHQLFLTEMDAADFNPLCHTRPPLRTQRDKEALRKGLTGNGIDAICSDHQPHELDAKLAPFAVTEPGISALETMLPLTLRLVAEEVLSLPQAIARVTCDPARILGIDDLGHLGAGAVADLCIVDPEIDWECQPADFLSRGKNSPFAGWPFRGVVMQTFVGGELVYQRETV
jgi:dihydroorotase